MSFSSNQKLNSSGSQKFPSFLYKDAPSITLEQYNNNKRHHLSDLHRSDHSHHQRHYHHGHQRFHRRHYIREKTLPVFNGDRKLPASLKEKIEAGESEKTGSAVNTTSVVDLDSDAANRQTEVIHRSINAEDAAMQADRSRDSETCVTNYTHS